MTGGTDFWGAFGGDGFLTILDRERARLEYGSFLGGSDMDGLAAVAALRDGRVLVVGESYSEEFPVTLDSFDPSHNGASDA